MKLSKIILVMTVTLTGYQAQAATEYLSCKKSTSSTKSECTNKRRIGHSTTGKVDYRINYDHKCSRFFSRSTFVVSTSSALSESNVIIPRGKGTIDIKEANSVYFGWTGSSKLVVSKDCTMKLSVQSLIPDSKIAELKGEANVLQERLTNQLALYKQVSDNNRFYENVSRSNLLAMEQNLVQAFWDITETAMNNLGDEVGDIGNLDDVFGMQLDEAGLIRKPLKDESKDNGEVYKEDSITWIISPNDVDHVWFNQVLGNFDFIEKVLNEIVSIKNAVALRDANDFGEFELLTPAQVKEMIEETITQANKFIAKVKALKGDLVSVYSELETVKNATASEIK